MSIRKINILDKIGTLIPGYSGYAIRDNIRNSDKKIRTHICNKLQKIENQIEELKRLHIFQNNIQKAKEFEIVRKSLNTLTTKIEFTNYGASSFFEKNQIKEEELETIYKIDEEILERVDVMDITIIEYSSEELTTASLNHFLKELEILFNKRSNFIQQF